MHLVISLEQRLIINEAVEAAASRLIVKKGQKGGPEQEKRQKKGP